MAAIPKREKDEVSCVAKQPRGVGDASILLLRILCDFLSNIYNIFLRIKYPCLFSLATKLFIFWQGFSQTNSIKLTLQAKLARIAIWIIKLLHYLLFVFLLEVNDMILFIWNFLLFAHILLHSFCNWNVETKMSWKSFFLKNQLTSTF